MIPDKPKLANTPIKAILNYYLIPIKQNKDIKILCIPARSGLSCGSENLSYNDTTIEQIPSTRTTDKYTNLCS